MTLTNSRTLLAVWAHPDDEAFCGAGLMLLAAQSGWRVVNVTATLGEHGTNDPTRWPPRRLAGRRRAELEQALQHLGGATLEVLGVPDGACQTLDVRLGTRRVAAMIEKYRPAMIVTFGDDGVTGHPDHQAVHRWTLAAARDSAPGIPVLTAVTARAWPHDLLDPLDDVGAFFPGYPDRRVCETDIAIALSGELLERKLAALCSHTSQIGGIADRLGESDFRRLFSHEAYRPATGFVPPDPFGRLVVRPDPALASAG